MKRQWKPLTLKTNRSKPVLFVTNVNGDVGRVVWFPRLKKWEAIVSNFMSRHPPFPVNKARFDDQFEAISYARNEVLVVPGRHRKV